MLLWADCCCRQVGGQVRVDYNIGRFGTDPHYMHESRRRVNDESYHVVRFILQSGVNASLRLDSLSPRLRHIPSGRGEYLVVVFCI